MNDSGSNDQSSGLSGTDGRVEYKVSILWLGPLQHSRATDNAIMMLDRGMVRVSTDSSIGDAVSIGADVSAVGSAAGGKSHREPYRV